MAKPIPAETIRQKLIESAEAHAKRFNISLSAISEGALGDNKFLADVMKRERNFTIKSYEAVLNWMETDAATRRPGAAA